MLLTKHEDVALSFHLNAIGNVRLQNENLEWSRSYIFSLYTGLKVADVSVLYYL